MGSLVGELRKELEELLFTPPFEVVQALCGVIDDLTEDSGQGFSPNDLSTTILSLFGQHNSIPLFFRALIDEEVKNTKDESTLFRQNCMVTKLLTNYTMKVGIDYLRVALKPLLRSVLQREIDEFETDPNRAGSPEKVAENTENLIAFCRSVIVHLYETVDGFPMGLRILCRELHLSVREKFPKSEYSVVGGLIFLRFICPAIISPESYGIIPSAKVGKKRRILVLTSKVLQNISNNFLCPAKSGTIESMNDFISQMSPVLSGYFKRLCARHPEAAYYRVEMSELLVDKELTRILEYLKAHIHKLGVSLVSGNSQNVKKVISDQLSEKKGYLHKKGEGFVESWRKRYFILRKQQLLYFKSLEDSHAAGVIQLSDYEIVNIDLEELTFQLDASHRTYSLKAPDKKELLDWTKQIDLHTKKPGPTRASFGTINSFRTTLYATSPKRSSLTDDWNSDGGKPEKKRFEKSRTTTFLYSANPFSRKDKRDSRDCSPKQFLSQTRISSPPVEKKAIQRASSPVWGVKPQQLTSPRTTVGLGRLSNSGPVRVPSIDRSKRLARSASICTHRESPLKIDSPKQSGYMEIWNEAATKWTRCWFVLEDVTLHQYKSKTDNFCLEKILLPGASLIVSSSTFTINRGSYDYTFRTNHRKDIDMWVEKLKDHFKSPTAILSAVLKIRGPEDEKWEDTWVELGSRLISTYNIERNANTPSKYLKIGACVVHRPEPKLFEIGIEDSSDSFYLQFKTEKEMKEWMSAIKVGKVSFWKKQNESPFPLSPERGSATSNSTNEQALSPITKQKLLFTDAMESGYLQLYDSKEKRTCVRYWFVLRDKTLSYYKGEFGGTPVGTMDISTVIVHADNNTDSFFMEIASSSEKLYLEASDSVDFRSWQRAFHSNRSINQPIGNEDVNKTGYLYSILSTEETKYYFSLVGNTLTWFAEDDEAKEHPIGHISVENCMFKECIDSDVAEVGQCGIQICNPNVKDLYLLAESEMEKRAWLYSLKKAKLIYWTSPTMLVSFQNRGYLVRIVGKKKFRRWFILHDIYLVHFKSPRDHCPEGEIIINRDAHVVSSNTKESNFRFEIHSENRTVILEACNSINKEQWMHALRDAPRHHKPLPEVSHSYLSLRTPELEGYLLKQGANIKNWKRRWFVLQYPCLFYFQSNQINPGEHSGVIPLRGSNVIVKKHTATIEEITQFQIETRNRIYFLHADTEEILDNWVQTIKKLQQSDTIEIDEDKEIEGRKGTLAKRGRNNKIWRKRYFALNGNILSYYRSEQDTEPMGVIPLEGCSVNIADDAMKRKFSFVVSTRYRNYFLAASDQFDMAGWIESIRFHSKCTMKIDQPEFKNVELFNKLNAILTKCAQDNGVLSD